jgi:hypothetical protein
VLRDRLAATTVLALVRLNLPGALALDLLGGLNGRQCLSFVEQHRLIGIDNGGVCFLR